MNAFVWKKHEREHERVHFLRTERERVNFFSELSEHWTYLRIGSHLYRKMCTYFACSIIYVWPKMVNLTTRQHSYFALKYDLYMINDWMSDFDIHRSEPPASCILRAAVIRPALIVGVCNTQLLLYIIYPYKMYYVCNGNRQNAQPHFLI